MRQQIAFAVCDASQMIATGWAFAKEQGAIQDDCDDAAGESGALAAQAKTHGECLDGSDEGFGPRGRVDARGQTHEDHRRARVQP